MTIVVDASTSPRLITVPISDGVSITIQSLHDQLKTWEEQPNNMSYPRIILSSGKESLPGGKQVWITSILQDAQLAFEARVGPGFIQCEVGEGNLVAVDSIGADLDPIFPTAFTQVIRTLASGGVILNGDITDQIVENGLSVADVLRILLAADGGDVSGAGTTTVTIVAADGSKTRLVATVDAAGNRTVTTLDGSV